jgi:hypothetical protein
MPKVTSVSTNFTAGEWSPKSRGRFDLAKYQNSAKIIENFVINQLGGGLFRPGTRFIAETKDSAKASRLIPFQYSADQDYVVEAGDEYFRLYSNAGDAIDVSQGFDSYTKLLLHCDGDDESVSFVDEIGNIVTPVGTVQIDTDVADPFGTSDGTALFDGDSDYLDVPTSADFDFGSDPFTIDMWIRFDVVNTHQTMISSCDTGRWRFSFDGTTNTLLFDNYQAAAYRIAFTASWTPLANTWYHVAVIRISSDNANTSWAFAIDGVIKTGADLTLTQGAWSAAMYLPSGANASIRVGTLYQGPNEKFLDGRVDEVRVSKGIARWTADFDKPTTPYAPLTSTEVATTYLEADLFDLHYAQNNDVLYIVHPDYAPRKLSRTSATAFDLSLVSFVRGPFLDTNITAVTITPTSDTGATTLNSSAGDIFHFVSGTAADEQLLVGSLFRVKDGVVKIVTVASATQATGTVQAEPDGTAGDLGTGPGATLDWAEGAFSGYRGYPATVAFHEQRLAYANTEHEPQKFWLSVIGAYDNFDVGTTADDDACTFEVASEQRSAIQWMLSGSKALQLGTLGGTVSATTGNAEPISATNPPLLSRDTNYGVSNLMPKRISSFLYYIQRDYNKLRELSYDFNKDAHLAGDMTLYAEHVLTDGDGVVDIDHQQSPNDRIYCVRDDGQLAVLTRNPEQEVMGWARFIAGTDSTGTGLFESVCVIPKSQSDDQVWVIVNRTIGGTTKRFIEFFMPEQFDEDWDAVRVDSSLTLDSPKTITGATSANPVVITSAAHGFSNGDYVKINGVVGMTELNGNIYKVADKADDTFELTDTDDADIDGSAYETYISGGEVRKGVTSVSGLSHLEGEVVSVQVDGYLPSTETYTVAGGAITLSARAYVVHAGLPYTGMIQIPKLSDGSATGTGQTKNRRIYQVTLRCDRTQGMSIGRSETTLDDITYDDTSLFSGDIEKIFQTSWGKGDEIIIYQDKPLPAEVLAVIILSQVEES